MVHHAQVVVTVWELMSLCVQVIQVLENISRMEAEESFPDSQEAVNTLIKAQVSFLIIRAGER